MKRRARPVVSAQGEQFLCVYEQKLRTRKNLTAVSICTSLSDLRHVVAWDEQKSTGEQEEERTFTPEGVATSTITRSRVSLQRECHLKPASIKGTQHDLQHAVETIAWA